MLSSFHFNPPRKTFNVKSSFNGKTPASITGTRTSPQCFLLLVRRTCLFCGLLPSAQSLPPILCNSSTPARLAAALLELSGEPRRPGRRCPAAPARTPRTRRLRPRCPWRQTWKNQTPQQFSSRYDYQRALGAVTVKGGVSRKKAEGHKCTAVMSYYRQKAAEKICSCLPFSSQANYTTSTPWNRPHSHFISDSFQEKMRKCQTAQTMHQFLKSENHWHVPLVIGTKWFRSGFNTHVNDVVLAVLLLNNVINLTDTTVLLSSLQPS